MTDQFEHRRRWYDTEDKVEQVVHAMVPLPNDAQWLVCDNVALIADEVCWQVRPEDSYRSIGLERLERFYKSKNRQREYDGFPAIHKTMNCLGILPRDLCTQVADRSLSLVQCAREYHLACKRLRQSLDYQVLQGLFQMHIVHGEEEGRRLMHEAIQSMGEVKDDKLKRS